MKNAKKNRKNKYKKQSRKVIAGILLVALLASGMLFAGNRTLKAREKAYEAQKAALQTELLSETRRAEELAQEEIRVQTKEYIIEMAKTKLGLVNPGETILRPEARD